MVPRRLMTTDTTPRPARLLLGAGLATVLVVALAGPSAAAIRGQVPATWVTSGACASVEGIFTVDGRTRTCAVMTRQVLEGEAATSSTSLTSPRGQEGARGTP